MDQMKPGNSSALNKSKNVKVPPKKITRSASTSAVKPRTAWCPLVVQTKAGYEIHILWKDWRNGVKLYKDKDTKSDFGRVVNAEIVTETNNKDETNQYYKMTNEYGISILFKKVMMSPAILGSNAFSKMMISIRCKDQGDIKIAAFLSRLSRSKDFSHHDGNSFTDDGLKLESPGLEDNQEEFASFMNTARDNALQVSADLSDVEGVLAVKTNRKRNSEGRKKIKKLSKQERIEKYFNIELKDPKGVEKEHVEKFKGRADINLNSLEISNQVHIPVDHEKVQLLARSMMERFDPAELTLTAVPADLNNFNEHKLEENSYEVVHGRHR